jgi:hypothetical protein
VNPCGKISGWLNAPFVREMSSRRKLICFLTLTMVTVVVSRASLYVCMPQSLERLFTTSGGDYRQHYLPVARHLAYEKQLTDPNTGELDTFFPPGYSVFLAGLLSLADLLRLPFEPLRFSCENLILVPMTALGLYVFWQLLGLRPMLAGAAALAYVVYPLYIWSSITPLSAVLFTCLLVWTCVAWTMISHDPRRLFWYCAFGAGLGLCMLVRPILILLPVFAVVLMCVRQQPWPRILAMLVCLAIVTGPWILTASLSKGHFVFSTNGIYTLSYGMFNYFPTNQVTEALRADPAAQQNLFHFLRFVVHQMWLHPWASLCLWSGKAVRSWYGIASQVDSIQTLIGLANLLLLTTAAFGMMGSRLPWSSGKKTAKQTSENVIVLLASFWAITTLTGALVRYMVPVLWIPFGFMVLFLRRLAESCCSRREASRGASAPN